MNSTKLIFATAIFLMSAMPFLAQQQERHPGIILYEQGKYREAVSALDKASNQKEFKASAEVFNYLGLALIETGESKKATKNLGKAVALNPTNQAYRVNLAYAYLRNRQVDKAQSETEAVIKVDPKNISAYFLHGTANLWEGKLDSADNDADSMLAIDRAYPEAYIMKSDVLIARMGAKVGAGSMIKDEITLLKAATDILSTGVVNCKNSTNFKKIESEFESVNAFYSHFANRKPWVPGTVVAAEPGVEPLKILSKQKASYTEAARKAGVQGTIQLAVLFSANGRIENLMLIKGLGYGLDQQAMTAARRITFAPMKRDGKPVSTVKLMEYSFAIY